MSNFEYKDNTGTLRKNDKKPEGSNQPDYKGSGKIDGVNKDFSAWLKKDKNGVTFMSLQFKEPWVKGEKQVQRAKSDHFDDLDSDLAF